MPTRTARTGWTGTLEQGVGKVELTSSKLATYEVSFPKRAAEDAGGATSPEELIAAAHSSCYAMQLSALVAQAGGTPQALDVQADVSLGPDPAGGFKLTGIKLTVRGEVDGLNAEQFAQAARATTGGPGGAGAGGPSRRGPPGVCGGGGRAGPPPRARFGRPPGWAAGPACSCPGGPCQAGPPPAVIPGAATAASRPPQRSSAS